ncbi:AAA domain-containing protein [Nocardia callitridis]|uniref:AAA domain-containing protein n=1 Tax=Nocardia callitridis TaxID=648753 RepID=A0ABP9KHS5_9NOCA
MLDPRGVAVVILNKQDRTPQDKTLEITQLEPLPDQVRVRFSGPKDYWFRWDRITILQQSEHVSLGRQAKLLVDGSPVEATEAYRFVGPPGVGAWWHVWQGRWKAHSDSAIRVVPNAAITARSSSALSYWRAVVQLQTGDAGKVLQRNYQRLDHIHRDSILPRILEAGDIEAHPDERIPQPLYPFKTNICQSAAVDNALRYPISVIDGPPGTGKTETILNIIASVICRPGVTVGLVSFSNAAVDNVRDKLAEKGFGLVAANLGRKDKKDKFFDTQGPRNNAVDAMLRVAAPSDPKTATELAKLNERMGRLREFERERAVVQHRLNGYRLEQHHFQAHFERHEVPENLPLLHRYSANKLLDFVADTDPRWLRDHGWARIEDAVNRYVKYRALRKVDADDVDVVLGIQRLYYEKKIAELERQVARLDGTLARKNFDDLLNKQARLSQQILRDALCARYASLPRTTYAGQTYRKQFGNFMIDYPLILSTCHSLQNSIGESVLLDYLIIDEASQVDLVTVAPALACARNLIVVGDLEQLPPVTTELSGLPTSPDPTFDHANSILNLIARQFGDRLHRVMLREHYRCDPDIIEFCNRNFYGGKLIPYTSSTPGYAAMTVVRTKPGNHMRRTYKDDDPMSKGRSNQRELDVIQHEVIPWVVPNIEPEDIGITTPYRRQANKAAKEFVDAIESDTVHKFQGRQKDAVIMTTVLDDSDSGRDALAFADDPKLINVAVSRAKRLFVLVTHPSELPKSLHLRNLIGYIRYRDPNHAVVDSDIASIFDLLYADYAERKRRRIGGKRTAVPSEDIVLTMLEDLLDDPAYRHLGIHRQVSLKNVFQGGWDQLTARQREFMEHRSTSFDFLLYNRITSANLGAIEVDGFRYHEADPAQLARDEIKDGICAHYEFRILRLPTTGSNEVPVVRRFLDRMR